MSVINIQCFYDALNIKMKILLVLFLYVMTLHANAGSVFVGYDFGEMAFNDFKHFAGEVGYTFESKNAIKLVRMDVAASEKHLSSDFAQAVDGKHVEGLYKGFELFYLMPIKNGFYWGPSIGYYENSYRHTILNESVYSETFTLGVAVGYRENKLFGLDRFYFDFSVPIRYSFDGFKETKLGDSTVNDSTIQNNVWFTVGLKIF